MNRRQILKAALLVPLVGLFKSRKSGASTGLTKIPPTSGTSGDTDVYIINFDHECQCGNRLITKCSYPKKYGDFICTCARCGKKYNLTPTSTSGGDYTCWHFLDEEPETYNGTSGGVVAYRVSWEDKKMHVEKVSSDAFYEASLFNDYNLI